MAETTFLTLQQLSSDSSYFFVNENIAGTSKLTNILLAPGEWQNLGEPCNNRLYLTVKPEGNC